VCGQIEMVGVENRDGTSSSIGGKENYYNSAFVLARDQMARAHCAASDLGKKKQ
jgi:hypothetical protein